MRNSIIVKLEKKYLSNVRALREVMEKLAAEGRECEVARRCERPVLLIDGAQYQMDLRKTGNGIAGADTAHLTRFL